MSKRIGFVILSHNNPQQLLRLVRCLQRIYDNPPIAIHHDIGQSPLRRRRFPVRRPICSSAHKNRLGKVFACGCRPPNARTPLPKRDARLVCLAECRRLSNDAGRTKCLKTLASSQVDALLDYREVPACPIPTITSLLDCRSQGTPSILAPCNRAGLIPRRKIPHSSTLYYLIIWS